MEELQAKLQKRKEGAAKFEEKKTAPSTDNGQLANLANILQQTKKTEPAKGAASSGGSRRELASLDSALLGLEKEFDWISSK